MNTDKTAAEVAAEKAAEYYPIDGTLSAADIEYRKACRRRYAAGYQDGYTTDRPVWRKIEADRIYPYGTACTDGDVVTVPNAANAGWFLLDLGYKYFIPLSELSKLPKE